MANLDELLQRIDNEFSAAESKIKSQQAGQLQEYEGRKQRLGQLATVFEQMRQIWGPRLEALARKFGDKVQVSPHVTPSTREADFKFQSNLARIELRFSATSDHDVRNIILNYDLEILPVLMKFESHADISFPLDQVDAKQVEDWIDNRIVAFVRTYLSLHENTLYLKDVMVEDPIANVSFPKFAAAATVEHGGKTYYFIGNETRREFEQQQGITPR